MAEKANITSVHALERFRTALISYVEKTKATVDEVTGETQRTKFWLQYDMMTYWRGEHKRRYLDWQEKQQELFSAEISQLTDSSTVQRWAVEEAKRTVDEAEAKLRLVKDWNRRFESMVMPDSKKVDKLGAVLDKDMKDAIRFLTEAVKALNDYAEAGGIDVNAARERVKRDETMGDFESDTDTDTDTVGEDAA